MNETLLRVIQALEIQESFEYILQQSEIEYLQSQGYKVIVYVSEFFWLKRCIITRGNNPPQKT